MCLRYYVYIWGYEVRGTSSWFLFFILVSFLHPQLRKESGAGATWSKNEGTCGLVIRWLITPCHEESHGSMCGTFANVTRVNMIV